MRLWLIVAVVGVVLGILGMCQVGYADIYVDKGTSEEEAEYCIPVAKEHIDPAQVVQIANFDDIGVNNGAQYFYFKSTGEAVHTCLDREKRMYYFCTKQESDYKYEQEQLRKEARK